MLRPPSPRSSTGRGPQSAIAGAVVSIALLLCVPLGEGIAQEADGPLRLIPEQPVEPADDHQEPGEADTAESKAEPIVDLGVVELPEPAQPASAESGIEVGALDAIDPDAAGVLLPGVTRYPGDLWSGSRRARVEALLPRLPVAAPSAAMRHLALALLTSPATPPAGQGEPGALVLARAERLTAMGARDAAVSLLQAAGPPGGADAIARIRNDGWLSALDYGSACERILGKAGPGDSYWHRVRILCQAHAGLLEAATLGLELLFETDASPDLVFDDAIYAMAGLAEPVVDARADPTPLRVAAWRLAQLPIPVAAVASASPDVLTAIVGARESLPGTRLMAAERAEATGALTVEALRGLYREMAFSPEEHADALAQVETLEPALGRALMLQAIEAQTAPALRAELLAAALSLAEAQGAYGTAARALAHLVRTVPPQPEHGWFSGAAGRALAAAGDRDAAAGWYALASDEAPRDAEAARAAVRLWPLMLLNAEQIHVKEAPFEVWLALRAEEGERSVALVRANWLVVLADALGGQIDPEVWDRLLAEGRPMASHAPAPALAHGLRSAAEGGQLGESVLMALLMLGDGGPAAAGLATVGPVVSGLISVGLRDEARAIALEAALAAGL